MGFAAVSEHLPPAVVSGSLFAFAEIPDLSFCEGQPDSEEMGIFISDVTNRIQKGDPWWKSVNGRLQRNADFGGGSYVVNRDIQLQVLFGGFLPPSVSYDTSIGKMVYGGASLSGAKHECYARLAYGGVYSNVFMISVYRPTIVYTANNPNSLKRLVTDTPVGGGPEDPHVILFMDGIYSLIDERRKWAYEATSSAQKPRVIASLTTGFVTTITFTEPHGWKHSPPSNRTVWFYGFTGGLAFLNDTTLNSNTVTTVDATTVTLAVDTTGIVGGWVGAIASTTDAKEWSMPASGTRKYAFGQTTNGTRPRFFIFPGSTNLASFAFQHLSNIPADQNNRLISYMRNVDLYGYVEITGTTRTSNQGVFGLPRMDVYTTKCVFGFFDVDMNPGPSTDGIGSDAGDGGTLDAIEGSSGQPEARKGLPMNLWERQTNQMWNMEISNWVGSSGQKHPVYVHGRPEGWLITNNLRILGASATSAALKTTRYHVRHRNNLIYNVRTPYDATLRSNQRAFGFALDFPNNCDAVVFNNKIVCWRYGDRRTAIIVRLTPRRSLWGGNDGPGYPEIAFQHDDDPTPFVIDFQGVGKSYQTGHSLAFERNSGAGWVGVPSANIAGTPGTDAYLVSVPPAEFADGLHQIRLIVNGVATEGPPSKGVAFLQVERALGWFCISSCYPWPATARSAESNVGPATRFAYDRTTGLNPWYTAAGVNDDGTLNAWGRDPSNPYMEQIYFSYMEYEWVRGAGENPGQQHVPIRCEGSTPRSAAAPFANESAWGPIPSNFNSCSVTRMANFRFKGWKQFDLEDTSDDGKLARWFQTQGGAPRESVGDIMTSHAVDYYGPTEPHRQSPDPEMIDHGGLFVDGPDGVLINDPEIDLPAWWKI